jgi:Cu/Ag efflux pump CusA
MTSFLVRWSLQFRLLVLAVAAGIIAMGIVLLPDSPVDALPEFAPAHVEIQTEALGLSAVEVEQLITSPMEVDLLNGVAFVDEIRSESVPGLSSVELVFEPGTDLLRARQLVAERLTMAHALPNVSTPPILMQPLSSTSRIMMVRLSSTEIPLIDMSVLARWNIKPRLMGVPGVANVSIWGQREQQMQVQVDPEVLRQRGVTLSQVIQTTGNAVWVSPLTFLKASTPGTGGFLETANQRIGIQHVLPITTPADLAQVSVEGVTGDPLVLGDVTTVVEDHQPLIGDAVGQEDPALLLVIEKFPEANTLAVTKELEEALDDLRPGLTGIEMDNTVYLPAATIGESVRSLGIGLLVSLLLAAGLLGLFFRSWRIALIGLLVIAVSATGAALVLYALGVVLNTMVFAGLVLALAVIVGDVVEDLQGLQRLRSRRAADADEEAPPSKAELIGRTLQDTRYSILFAALITALAVMPALFLDGLDGALFRPLVLSYLLALAVAMLAAWTVTPALAATLLTAGSEGTAPRFAGKLRRRHRRILDAAAARSKWTIAAAAVAAVAGAAAIPMLAAGQPAVPATQGRTLLIQWDTMPGTSNEEMGRISDNASRELRALPGVVNVGGHVGRAITSDEITGDVSSAELWVTMAEDADHDAVTAAVNEIVGGYPGVDGSVLTYGQDRLLEERNRTEHDFLVRIYGIELDVLREQAEQVRQVMARTEGVESPRLNLPPEQPIAEIEVDLAAAEAAGIKPGDVRRSAAALLQGIEVGFLFEQQKVFQVVVKGVPATRNSITSVEELLIDTPDGGHVRLGEVADVRIAPSQTVIRHDDTSRHVDVVADLDGRSVGAVAAEVRTQLAQLDFPLEYHAQIPERFEAEQDAARLVWALAAAAVIGIVILLQTALGSWRLAAAVTLALPLALAGGVLGALLSGGIGSQLTLIGFAAVLGVAARDSILLMRRAQDIGSGEQAAALQAARERLLPTAATTLMTAALLLPLVLFGGTLGRDVILPLAAVVWGGLVASAVLTLIVLPVVLLLIGVEVRDDETKPERVPAATGRSEGEKP